ncbi:MAG TPA: PQQ-dependent sugar dehydrogenase [Bryobacteraceae bacterium]|nr:PQQ-dependent sugar dehydrogenase [Bryobacteraceae bacterium]
MKPYAVLCLALCSAGLYAAESEVKLPAPYATPSARNFSKVVPRPTGAELQLPAGFVVEEYLSGFERPRFMLLGPSKELLIADTAPGTDGVVYVVVGKEKKKLITGLDRPFGMAFWKDYLYVGEPTSIKRYKYDAKAMTAGAGEEVVPLKGFGKGHNTRFLLFDRKGEKMYVGIGSESNVNTGEDSMRAAINRYNPDGSGHEIFASGTRNPTSLGWYPGTDTLWAGVEERDELGDDVAPEYFTHIQQGGFYGWPYAYIGSHEDPRHKGDRPDLVAKAIVPDVILPAHASMLGFTFYTGKQFPKEYQGGAFLAWHGSWNRSKRLGYEIAYVPFEKGKPSGPARDFMTGWMISPDSPEVWGRPVGVMQMTDGSLLVSDDGGKKVWRISYKGK